MMQKEYEIISQVVPARSARWRRQSSQGSFAVQDFATLLAAAICKRIVRFPFPLIVVRSHINQAE